jgi:Putative porin
MRCRTAAALLCGLNLTFSAPALAAGESELLELRNTIMNLVDELVRQGVISAEKAEEMKAQAALKAREEAAQAAIEAGRERKADAPAGSSVVRVPYVPEFVKDEIRAEVRKELREEVTQDVVAAGKADRWGSRIALSGDLRLRGVGLYLDDLNNDQVPNIQAINEAGGVAQAGEDAFSNTTQDLARGQVRLRLGAEATLSPDVSVVARLATGNDTDPTTRNQRLGTDNRPFDVFVDLAYLDWRPADPWASQNFRVRGGRLPNPFRSTNLVFDEDLTFDGATIAYQGRVLDGGLTVFANLGGFALLAEQANFFGGVDDKSWWGSQLGVDLQFGKSLGLTVAGAYYNFNGVVGVANAIEDDSSQDWTAPSFVAKGNTVFDIRRADLDRELFGLATDFELVNGFLEVDFARLDPIHVIARADFVQNIGFDSSEVSDRVGFDVPEKTTGWFVQLEVGHPTVRRWGDWQVFGGYKRIERDAVLDSFTDSDFYAGGTDAKGWFIGGSLGLTQDLRMRARWFSADEIDGALVGDTAQGTVYAPLAIDVFQLDVNAQF